MGLERFHHPRPRALPHYGAHGGLRGLGLQLVDAIVPPVFFAESAEQGALGALQIVGRAE